ncbi:DUF2500 family protein [Paenibacillus sp. GCM10023252]|uniref:DUF2500 family protein n=1 Tax=Paenibacillus sp. GCM10023252 TaxID=3252649 RepID=UPI003610903D
MTRITGEVVIAIVSGSVILFVFIGFVIRNALQRRVDRNLPIQTTQSRVLFKRIEEFRNGQNSPSMNHYFVKFEIESGNQEFKIWSKEKYDELVLGQEGYLKYQLKKNTALFIDFSQS